MCKRQIYLTCFVLTIVAIPLVTHAQVVNLIANPSFEEDEVIFNDPDWESWGTWNSAEGAGSTAEIDETEFIDGKRSLRIEPLGTANWHFIVLALPILVDVDKDYTISFWAKSEEPRTLTLALKATDNSIAAWGDTDFDLTTEWAEYHYASEVLIDDVKLEIWCSASETPFWLDYVLMYEGDYVPGMNPTPPLKASEPDPVDGSFIEQTWATLSWIPGELAVSHDVYMGENLDDVNNGAGDTFRGNQTDEFYVAGFPGFAYPDGLVNGTTYFWRIDEVNDADPNSPWKGDVWSFTVTPQTAYLPQPADGEGFIDLNVQLSWTAGFEAKLHYIVFGEDFD
ncbi:carbohydrate binding domain-containing protein, partial [Planctomycetota bacterium]